MSILINIEMPDSCEDCPLIQTDENYYGDVMSQSRNLIYKGYLSGVPRGERRKDCPLIEVPEDVQPVKHGRWISIGHKLSRICSVCNCDEPYKFADDDANVYDYCPNCGAKMDGET